MDNDKQESLWDSLANELGADASPDASERRQPEATELPSAAKPDRPAEPPKAKPSDWKSLADTLGLEVPEEAEPEEATSSAPVSDEPIEAEVEDFGQSPEEITFDELPELTSSSEEEVQDFSFDESGLDDLAEPSVAHSDFDSDLENSADEDSEMEDSETEDSDGISGEAARDAFDALFAEASTDWELPSSSPNMFDTPLEFSREDSEESSDDDAAKADSDSESAEEESTEKPKRRRRRRRRGRRGRGDDKGEEKTEQIDSSDLEESVEASADSTDEDSDSDGEEKPERPKRRRRRRGRRGGSKPKELAEGESDSREDEDDDLGEFADDEEPGVASGNGAGPTRQRASHRNLPTWTEAIGCIVDANLEQRSKAPAKQSSSRGRGRGRGRRKNSNRE